VIRQRKFAGESSAEKFGSKSSVESSPEKFRREFGTKSSASISGGSRKPDGMMESGGGE
jgi:hypothetical protein